MKISKDDKGYSFIELVISILVFAVGFLGVTKMEQYAIMGNSFSHQMSNSINVADSQVEYIRGLSIDNADLTIGTHNGDTVESQGILYNLSWTVSTTGLGPTVNARNVNIQVNWVEKETDHSLVMNLIRSSSS